MGVIDDGTLTIARIVTPAYGPLIQAAPDMLEACKTAAALIRGSGFTGNTKALIQLHAAIAKAEGQ